MLLPARRASVLILAIFVILLFVAFTRQFEPRTWIFKPLKDLTQGPSSGSELPKVDTPVVPTGTPLPDLGQGGNDGESVSPPPVPEPTGEPEVKQPEETGEVPEPPKDQPPQNEAPKEEPPKEEPPKAEPPKEERPKIDPTKWLKNIRDYNDTSISRLACPQPNLERYSYLKDRHFPDASPQHLPPYKPYFITLNLHQCIKVLPRLLGSIVETIRVLGPHNVALSVVEGRSTDGTYEVLAALTEALPDGVEYYFSTSDIDPTKSGRIGSLAELRNLAVKPLLDHPERFSADNTTVIFFNDVAACPDDLLELVHQKVHQEADMTCAMDWNYVDYSGAYRLTFYDVWIARTMSGQSFFHIPFGGSWNESMHLFFGQNDADRLSKARFERGLPFQVFACWNGGVVFDAAPIMRENVTFRLNRNDECYQGEVSLFTKDLWLRGHTKIAVVPSVNLAYDDDTAKRIQKEKGLPGDWVLKNRNNNAEKVQWKTLPPEKYLCIPDWVRQEQYWVPWND